MDKSKVSSGAPQERALENWLQTEVAASYDELKADPSLALSAADMRAALAAAHDRRTGNGDAAVQVTEAPEQTDLVTAIRRRIEPSGGVDLPEIKREPIRPVDLE